MSKRDQELSDMHFELSRKPFFGDGQGEVQQCTAQALDFGISAVACGVASPYVDFTYIMCLQLEREYIKRVNGRLSLRKAELAFITDKYEFDTASKNIDEDTFMLQRREANLTQAYDDLMYKKGV